MSANNPVGMEVDEGGSESEEVKVEAPSPSSSTSSSASNCGDDKKKLRFEITKWNGCACWSWDIETETCAICRNHIMDLCNGCADSQDTLPPGACAVARGLCGHAFHFHCISRWLETRPACPLDNNDWQLESIDNVGR